MGFASCSDSTQQQKKESGVEVNIRLIELDIKNQFRLTVLCDCHLFSKNANRAKFMHDKCEKCIKIMTDLLNKYLPLIGKDNLSILMIAEYNKYDVYSFPHGTVNYIYYFDNGNKILLYSL